MYVTNYIPPYRVVYLFVLLYYIHMKPFFRVVLAIASTAALISGANAYIKGPSVQPQARVSDEVIFTNISTTFCEYIADGVEPVRAGVRTRKALPQYTVRITEMHKAGTFLEDFEVAVISECPELF